MCILSKALYASEMLTLTETRWKEVDSVEDIVLLKDVECELGCIEIETNTFLKALG